MEISIERQIMEIREIVNDAQNCNGYERLLKLATIGGYTKCMLSLINTCNLKINVDEFTVFRKIAADDCMDLAHNARLL